MASTNKTPQLGLNQWAAGDEVLRTDFNADNLKIDALLNHSGCKIGTFIGDGKKNRVIDTGVNPKLIMLFGNYSASYPMIGFIIENAFYDMGDPPSNPAGIMRLTATGFEIIDANYCNVLGRTSSYFAFY